jgi:glucan phosphorylase
VTNGVTPRRWLAVSNPEQSKLMTSAIGDTWISNLEQLKKLEAYAEDSAFRAQWRKVQHDVKARLAQYILEDAGNTVDPSTMFDTQLKRIHEYKRQHLNALYILTLYLRLKKNPSLEMTPRTFLFGGKAAAGYAMAKLFWPDGAPGGRDQECGLRPRSIYESNPMLREVVDSLASGQFSRGDRNLFRPLIDNLLNSDPYLLFADYQSYVDCQDQVSATFLDQDKWAKMSIYSAARMGRFSSDRAVQEYCRNIWDVTGIQ